MSESQSAPKLTGYMETRKRFFSRTMPEGYAEEWSQILEQPMPAAVKREDSMLVFRIADLPLALSSRWVKAVTPPLLVCPIPHRANTALLGLVAYAGEIIPCCSLARILGAADSTYGREARIVVLEERPGERWALPVDAVIGISPGTLHPHDETNRQMGAEWSDTMFEDDRGHRVNVILPSILFHRLQRATK